MDDNGLIELDPSLQKVESGVCAVSWPITTVRRKVSAGGAGKCMNTYFLFLFLFLCERNLQISTLVQVTPFVAPLFHLFRTEYSVLGQFDVTYVMCVMCVTCVTGVTLLQACSS